MTINFNGKEMKLDAASTIMDLLNKVDVDSTKLGIALCLNLEVLPRETWKNTPISDQDRIDLVVAAPGG
ncbi:sulfur carrier protein ThiS [Lentisphaera profundi]|uniref:Sulfur carrier protein ThiS n=1 Tax=Lentisphaera profundi TaxID=1658616 RepID=A0ABY7VNV3_9BACT|nr:sulfur carrier protein ThiS [Lentisphaera profundi]WDE95823.1 sulfur carrier protein ThiS [Lentisphaera profundi]